MSYIKNNLQENEKLLYVARGTVIPFLPGIIGGMAFIPSVVAYPAPVFPGAFSFVGALVARPGRPALRVVVDDLTTTGSSLHEACRALAEAGTPASGCAVVAATPRRHRRHADNGGTLR